MRHRLMRRPGWFLAAWILFAPSAPAQDTFQDCPDCPRMAKMESGWPVSVRTATITA